MLIGKFGKLASGGRAREKAGFQQERLHHVDQGVRLLLQGRGYCLKADRTAFIHLDNNVQEPDVKRREPQSVNS